VRAKILAKSHARSISRVAALTGALTLHALGIHYLISETRPPEHIAERQSVPLVWFEAAPDFLPLTIKELEEPLPPRPTEPAPPPAPTPTPTRVQSRPIARLAAPTTVDRPAVAPPLADSVTAATPSFSDRLEEQRSVIATEMAKESARKRRPFAGRSIDAMLPGADVGMLPGFRPRTHDGNRETMRRLAKMLEKGLPTAAYDPDAPSDLLTEGWERAHHGSDMAACEMQYEELEPDLRRQMCGDVRPP